MSANNKHPGFPIELSEEFFNRPFVGPTKNMSSTQTSRFSLINKNKFAYGPYAIGTFVRQQPIREDITSSQIVRIVSDVIHPSDLDDNRAVNIYPKQIGEIVMDFNHTRNIGKPIDVQLRYEGMSWVQGEGWDQLDAIDVGKLGAAWNNFVKTFMSGTKR